MGEEQVLRCNCNRVHRSDLSFAECCWPRAVWIIGAGPFALLAHCRELSISLHRTRAHAEHDKALIDKTGCCGMCHGKHEIIEIIRTPRESTATPPAPEKRCVEASGPLPAQESHSTALEEKPR